MSEDTGPLVERVVADVVKRFGREGKLALNARWTTCFRVTCAIEDAVAHLSKEERETVVREIFRRLQQHVGPRPRRRASHE